MKFIQGAALRIAEDNNVSEKDRFAFTRATTEGIKFGIKLSREIVLKHFSFHSDQERMDGADWERAIESACQQIARKLQKLEDE